MVAEDPAVFEKGSGATEWWTIEVDDVLLYLSGEPPEVHSVTLERHGGRWRRAGSGGCTVYVHHEGRAVATWWLEQRPDPEATVFSVLASDRQCASGVSAEERVDHGSVVETDATVTVTFTAEALTGPQFCPSHPPARRTVRLAAPLGTRQLLDGALHPAQPVDR